MKRKSLISTLAFTTALAFGLAGLGGCTKKKNGTSEGEVKKPAADEKSEKGEGKTEPRGAEWDDKKPAKTEGAAAGKGPKVLIKTSMGDIVVQLNKEKAPITVKNFLRYAKEDHYKGTIFHRVIPNFMIQGGGWTPDFKKKPTHEPIKNEADNGLKNLRGTIAMARTRAVDSATAQFFINVKDNPALDYKGPNRYGYAVFGKVVKGMDVVDKIRNVPTGPKGPFRKDAPQTDVLIKEVKVMEGAEAKPEEKPTEESGKEEGEASKKEEKPAKEKAEPARKSKKAAK